MNVRYLDGRTSLEHPADLAFGPAGLTLHYVDPSGTLEEVFWPLDSLIPAQLQENRPIFLRSQGRGGAAIVFATVADFARLTAFYPNRTLIASRQATGQFSGSGTAGRLLLLGSAGILLLAVIAFFAIDSIGGGIALLFPRTIDEKAGQALYGSLVSSGKVKEDKPASDIAQQFYNATGFKSAFPVQLHVDRTSEVNAYALPGGPVIVNEGLIRKVQTADELAGVLAHELGHVEERHTFQHLVRMGAMYLVISALVGDVSGIVAVLVDNGQAIFGLSYSRRMESSADKFAVKQLADAGLDPKGMLRFFEVLKKEEVRLGADQLPDMLKTHPATENRMEDIRKELPASLSIDEGKEQQLTRLLARLKQAVGAVVSDSAVAAAAAAAH